MVTLCLSKCQHSHYSSFKLNFGAISMRSTSFPVCWFLQSICPSLIQSEPVAKVSALLPSQLQSNPCLKIHGFLFIHIPEVFAGHPQFHSPPDSSLAWSGFNHHQRLGSGGHGLRSSNVWHSVVTGITKICP